jgi:uncharacterized protein (UPF0332 family)
VSRILNPASLMAKAERACASARLLYEAGDAEGACNRAYYAMFDAARAALLTSGAPVRADIGKTHGGLFPPSANISSRPTWSPKILGGC